MKTLGFTASQNLPLHLAEAQIDDCLIGDPAPEATAHLARCQSCRERLAGAGLPIAHFQAVSLAWAERRSATLPSHMRARSGAQRRLAWASAAVAVLALGVLVPGLRELHRQAPAAHTMASVENVEMSADAEATDSPEQIARDNAMLEAVDRELSAPLPNAYSLVSSGGSEPKHRRSQTD